MSRPLPISCAWPLAVLGLALAGAAFAREPDPAALERAVPCCTTLAGLPFRPLPADRVELIAIGAESPVFDFHSGRSYVVALELPPIELPYIVQVRSYALGDVVQRSRVFYPAALLLDARHEVLARREPENLTVVKTTYGDATRENRWGLPLRLEWDILVDEPDTRYLVLHTTEQALAGRSSTTTRQAIPIILPGVVTAVPGPKQGVDVAHSPDGRLAVQVLR